MKNILISKAIYGEQEKQAVLNVLDGGWLGVGKYTRTFEEEFSKYLGVKHAMFVNSGSSALLLGLKSLDIPEGKEVISCAAGFPSTLNPILHLGYKPVLVDCELDTYNIDPEAVGNAVNSNTGGIVFAHAAGNPVNLEKLSPILGKYPSVEDACDTLGGEYNGRKIGSFGTVSAFSFYASHHITAAGGGGMVLTDDYSKIVRMYSMRDWGKRYITPEYYQRNHSTYETPIDGVMYDISYSYDTVGYNMKLIELGAAFASVQMTRLNKFIAKRNSNHKKLYDAFFKDLGYEKYFIPPRVYPNHTPSHFFFIFIIRDDMPFTRKDFADHLEANGIKTRPFFAGNILRQPALRSIPVTIVGSLKNSNKLMEDAVMVGVHPGIEDEDIEYMVETVKTFISNL